MQKPTKEYAYTIFALLKEHYPQAKMILQWSNNFELLVSIILSAQCTDKKVNEVTEVVFPKYKKEKEELEGRYGEYAHLSSPTRSGIQKTDSRLRGNDMVKGDPHGAIAPQDDKLDKEIVIQLVNFAYTPLLELEQDIKSTGFYHNKAKNVQAAAKMLLNDLHGVLPKSIAELTKIPGVGRKTANVFLGNAYGIYEGIAVDTHVTKQSQLLGLTTNTNPEKIEQDLMKLFDQKDWFTLTYLLIEHGRNMRRKHSDRILCGEMDCILCNPKF